MDKEEIESRVGQEIRSCHRYAFRSGQWALIKSVSKHSGGEDMWLLKWPDGVTDIWVPWDEIAGYEFRDNRDELVVLLREELNHDAQAVAEHLAWVLREAGYEKAVKDEKKEASLEDLEAAPVGARAVTADERVIEKSEDGWVVVGFIYEVPNHKSYETASAETAMYLSPLYLIGESNEKDH